MLHDEEFLRFILPWDDDTFKSVWVRDFDDKNKEFFYGKADKSLDEILRMFLASITSRVTPASRIALIGQSSDPS